MFGSQVLDVIIGLVFVYLLLSIICTAASEMIAALFALRSKNLEKGIATLFADSKTKNLDTLFFQHPLIKSLYRGRRKPSYIPSNFFSLAFLDGIAPFRDEAATTLSDISAAVNSLPDDSELKRLLLIFLHQAAGDFAKFKALIENWFDNAMTRAAGWYKRKSQVVVLILAVLVTGATNADTFQIVKSLTLDPSLRTSIALTAQEYARQHQETTTTRLQKPSDPQPLTSDIKASNSSSAEPPMPPKTTNTPQETADQSLTALEQLGIPFGWQTMPKKEEWINKIIGLVLTTLAVSLGAPFWFDVLNRLIKIRGSGSVPEKADQQVEKGKNI